MSRQQAISSFWNRYQTCLKQAAIPDQLHAYYAAHINQFIRYKGNTRLREVSPTLARQFLDELSRHPGFPAWRLQQITTALEILFVHLVRAGWALQFEWAQWKEDPYRELTTQAA